MSTTRKTRDMSRQIQWGIRQPQPENPDNIERVTRTCRKCHRDFTMVRGPESKNRKYCDECTHNRYIPKKREMVCAKCGDKFIASGRGPRKYCNHCITPKAGMPGDGPAQSLPSKSAIGGFEVDFVGSLEHSSAEHVDEFYRYNEHVGVTIESDLSYVLSEIERYDIVWGKSITNGPHQRGFMPPRFWQALDRAKPAPVYLKDLTIEQAIEKVHAWRGWGGAATYAKQEDRIKKDEMKRQRIAAKAEEINQRILEARAERLRAELSKIESALGGS